jgi:hypothetical protein
MNGFICKLDTRQMNQFTLYQITLQSSHFNGTTLGPLTVQTPFIGLLPFIVAIM